MQSIIGHGATGHPSGCFTEQTGVQHGTVPLELTGLLTIKVSLKPNTLTVTHHKHKSLPMELLAVELLNIELAMEQWLLHKTN